MNKRLCARDVMVQKVISLHPEMPLHDAWKVLSDHRISGAPVVNEDGTLVGVLSQTDLLREAYEEEFGGLPDRHFYASFPYFDDTGFKRLAGGLTKALVEDAMNQDLLAAEPNDEIPILAAKMREYHVHRLLVVDDGKLVGLVSALDLLKLLELQ